MLALGEWRLVVDISATLVRVQRMLRRLSRSEVIACLQEQSSGALEATTRDRTEEARRIGQLVNGVANRMPGKILCLPRSLTTWHVLRTRGIQCTMPVGVRTTATGERLFHTWVEVDGVPVNDRRDVASRYRRFDTTVATDGAWE